MKIPFQKSFLYHHFVLYINWLNNPKHTISANAKYELTLFFCPMFHYKASVSVMTGRNKTDMVKFNTVEEFAEHTDIETLLDIQYHVNKAIDKIREESLVKGKEGSATASISIALQEDNFLLIEFNYYWKDGVFVDENEINLTLLNVDEWLDYYNLHKQDFKIVKPGEQH